MMIIISSSTAPAVPDIADIGMSCEWSSVKYVVGGRQNLKKFINCNCIYTCRWLFVLGKDVLQIIHMHI